MSLHPKLAQKHILYGWDEIKINMIIKKKITRLNVK